MPTEIPPRNAPILELAGPAAPHGGAVQHGHGRRAGSGEGQQSGALRFGVLGPLHVSQNSAELPVRGGKPRKLLAALLLHTDRLVPTDRLVDVLWDGEAPPTARASLS